MMARKIGSFCALLITMFVASFCFGGTPEIFLYVTDLQNKPFDHIKRYQPFLLQVEAKNMGGKFTPPNKIPGSGTCEVSFSGTSQKTSIINGVRDEQYLYSYVVRGKKEGEFTFGPIETTFNGDQIISNKVTVTISDVPLVHKSTVEPFMFRTSIDKDEVYVNERVTITMRFYYRQNHDNLTIAEPDYPNCFIGYKPQAYTKGTERVDGHEFLYKELKISLYPQEPGLLELMPARALFTEQQSRLSGIFGSLQNMFGARTELYGEAFDIDVLSLPKSPVDKPVIAVGRFSKIYLELESNQGNVGEAIVGKLGIRGDGNLEVFRVPHLDMPDSIRYYTSTDRVARVQSGEREKTFELIFQGSKPGTFTIPSQQFFYFDPEDEEYKVIQTQEAELTLTGEALPEKVIQKPEAIEVDTDGRAIQENATFQFESWQIDQVYKGNEIHFRKNRLPSGQTFLYLCILLFTLLFVWIIGVHIELFARFLWRFVWYQRLYVWVTLLLLKRRKDVPGLYNLFKFFLQKYDVDIHQNFGVAFFKKFDCSEEEIDQWRKCVNRLLYIMYDEEKLYDFTVLHQDSQKMFALFFQKINAGEVKHEK